MSEPTLEERLSKFKELVDDLRQGLTAAGTRDWRRSVGVFDGDTVMGEIIEEGRRIREKDRREADSSESSAGSQERDGISS